MVKQIINLAWVIALVAIAGCFRLPTNNHAPTNLESRLYPDSPNFLKEITTTTYVDPNFSIGGNEILYSSAHEGRYVIRALDLSTRKSTALLHKNYDLDHFFPIRLGGRMVSLRDELGDQNYQLEGGYTLFNLSHLTRLFRGPTESQALFISRPQSRQERADIASVSGNKLQIHGHVLLRGLYTGHAFSPDGHQLAISSESGLFLLDLPSGLVTEIAMKLPGEKSGPVFDWPHHAIYFTALTIGGFREIYQINFTCLNNKMVVDLNPVVVYSSRHDKNQLSLDGAGQLYFVENEQTRYLLKRLNLRSKAVESLTSEGVVYRYALGPEKSLYYTYADEVTPLTLKAMNLGGKQTWSLTPATNHFSIGKSQWENIPGLSPAWIFNPPQETHGWVLMIHGGPDINVSPRWDPMINLWTEMGFSVVAPNYPGSRGFGRNYLELGFQAAEEDLTRWLGWIRKRASGKRVLVEGMSFGGQLAQRLVANSPAEISGLILRSTQLTLPDEKLLALPPTLVQFSRHDNLVPSEKIRNKLQWWLGHGSVFYREFENEGHILRHPEAIQSSLLNVAEFIRTGLVSKSRGTYAQSGAPDFK